MCGCDSKASTSGKQPQGKNPLSKNDLSSSLSYDRLSKDKVIVCFLLASYLTHGRHKTSLDHHRLRKPSQHPAKISYVQKQVYSVCKFVTKNHHQTKDKKKNKTLISISFVLSSFSQVSRYSASLWTWVFQSFPIRHLILSTYDLRY